MVALLILHRSLETEILHRSLETELVDSRRRHQPGTWPAPQNRWIQTFTAGSDAKKYGAGPRKSLTAPHSVTHREWLRRIESTVGDAESAVGLYHDLRDSRDESAECDHPIGGCHHVVRSPHRNFPPSITRTPPTWWRPIEVGDFSVDGRNRNWRTHKCECGKN